MKVVGRGEGEGCKTGGGWRVDGVRINQDSTLAPLSAFLVNVWGARELSLGNGVRQVTRRYAGACI